MKIIEYRRKQVIVESEEDFKKNLPTLLEYQKDGQLYCSTCNNMAELDNKMYIEYISWVIRTCGKVTFLITDETDVEEI